MKTVKNFIYIADDEYFEKTITLEKTSVRTTSVIFDLNQSKGINKFKQKKEMKRNINRVVSDNDVIVSSTDFTSGDVIITTGGVIVGNKLPASVIKRAAAKKRKRINEIASHFKSGAYLNSYRHEFETNFEFMDEVLIDLHKQLLTTEQEVDIDTYLTLLDCLVEALQPIKSSSYESASEKMTQEYHRQLVKEYRKNHKEEDVK